MPLATVEQVLGLYREQYFDCNVRHFHEKLREEQGLRLSYTWGKLSWQGAGLVAKRRGRGKHRQRRPLPGMRLHLDGIGEFHRKFAVPAAEPGTAFLPAPGRDLERVFAIQQERVGNRDHTVSWENRVLPIEKTPWRATLAGCRVTVYEHLDRTLNIGYGPHEVGRYTAAGMPVRYHHRGSGPPPARRVGALTPVALRAPSVSAPTQRGART